MRIKRGILVTVAALLLAACAAPQPVQNVSQSSIVTNKPNATAEDVRQAIVRAGLGLGWQMKNAGPGHMIGTLNLRQHVAIVDIGYDRNSYSIRYKDSTNLNYDGTNIHRNYNSWIQRLDQQIKIQLSAL